ncbi:MAG: type VI secretion-associated protein, partial [Candidatus Muproteobacteria bacterium RBG_19FT_COMBO_61_10]
MSGPGVYGKLPTHGDFIQRNLPSAFVRQWDVWLQHFV